MDKVFPSGSRFDGLVVLFHGQQVAASCRTRWKLVRRATFPHGRVESKQLWEKFIFTNKIHEAHGWPKNNLTLKNSVSLFTNFKSSWYRWKHRITKNHKITIINEIPLMNDKNDARENTHAFLISITLLTVQNTFVFFDFYLFPLHGQFTFQLASKKQSLHHKRYVRKTKATKNKTRNSEWELQRGRRTFERPRANGESRMEIPVDPNHKATYAVHLSDRCAIRSSCGVTTQQATTERPSSRLLMQRPGPTIYHFYRRRWSFKAIYHLLGR